MLNVLILAVFVMAALIAFVVYAAYQLGRQWQAANVTAWRPCVVPADSTVTRVLHSTQSSLDLECEADRAMMRGDMGRARLLLELSEVARIREDISRTELRWAREHPPVRVVQVALPAEAVAPARRRAKAVLA